MTWPAPKVLLAADSLKGKVLLGAAAAAAAAPKEAVTAAAGAGVAANPKAGAAAAPKALEVEDDDDDDDDAPNEKPPELSPPMVGEAELPTGGAGACAVSKEREGADKGREIDSV